MRPLTVLILVLGAVASLLFAFNSLMGDGSRTADITPVVRPARANLDSDQGSLQAPVETPESLEKIKGRVGVSAASVADGSDKGAHSGLLWGTVVDPNGQPIKDAKLSLLIVKGGPSVLGDGLHLYSDGAAPQAVREAKTDLAGGFRFEAIAPGRDWTIVASHPEFVRSEVGPIAVPAEGGIEERITLKFGSVLNGRVLDAVTRAPIAGAKLVVENPLASLLPSSRRQEGRVEVETDEMGLYSFRNLGSGQRSLTLTSPGYATQYHPTFTNTLQQKRRAGIEEPKGNIWRSSQVRRPEPRAEVKPEGPTVFDFAMQKGGSIAGRVVGPDRAGIPNVEVLANNQAGDTGSRGAARTVAGGEFVIEDLGPGVYTLSAEIQGYQGTPMQRVDLGDTDVEIVLAQQGGVSGRVVDAETGKPLSSFTCRVRTHHRQTVAWGNQVAEAAFHNRRDGSFSIGGVSEGEYVIEAVARGYASTFSQAFRVDQGIQTGDVEVRITKGGTLKGTVVDSYTGEPVMGAIVRTNDNNYVDSEIMILFSSLSSTAISKFKTTTDASGEFLLELMTPASYQVRVEKEGFTTVIQNDVNVADGVSTEVGKFTLLRGAIITGSVVDPDGEPVSGATVAMYSTDQDFMNSYQARTDANGRFRLQNARAGGYKLSASRAMGPNSNPFAPVVDLRHSEIEITVSDAGVYEYELSLGPKN